jgi:putative ATP-binding cassette transporter
VASNPKRSAVPDMSTKQPNRSSHPLHHRTGLVRFFIERSSLVTLFAFLLAAISGLTSVPLLAVINHVLENGAWSISALLVFVALCLARLITGISLGLLLARLTQTAVHDLGVQLARQIMNADLRQQERVGKHRFMACFNVDVNELSAVLVNLPWFLMNSVIVLACLSYLAYLSFYVFAGMMGCLIVGMASYCFLNHRAKLCHRQRRDSYDHLHHHLNSVLDGGKELRQNRARSESFVSLLLNPAAARVLQHTLEEAWYYTLASNWNRLLFFIYVGILIFLLPFLQPLPPHTLASSILTILYLMSPLEAVLNASPGFSRASVSIARIQEMGLSLTPTTHNGNHNGSLPAKAKPWTQLNLIDVTHTYHRDRDGSSFVLGPLNVTFHRNEITFIMGGNGSGKTTLVKVLTGQYAPESGSIAIDGAPVTDDNRDNYRQLFAVTFSDCYLFEHCLGVAAPRAELDQTVSSYLRLLHLDQKVTVSNGVLSTIALSQGQRKRLALLAAYLEDRDFYVFDEWAADQDPAFRAVFYTQLLRDLKAKGKSIVVITHDEQYAFVADRVIHLSDGQALEDLTRSTFPRSAARSSTSAPVECPAAG